MNLLRKSHPGYIPRSLSLNSYTIRLKSSPIILTIALFMMTTSGFSESIMDQKPDKDAENTLPLFQGNQYRYPNSNMFKRIALDLVALPASVTGWNAMDWAGFGAVAIPVTTLMWPGSPSLDVRFQNWVKEHRSKFLDNTLKKVPTNVMTGLTLGYMGIGWGSALLTKNETLSELISLGSEALTAGQIYHLTFKIMLGREGPNQGSRTGKIHGPTTKFFPGGTPSGHLITTSILTSVPAEYFDSWWLRGLSLAAMTYVGAASVYDNQHYLSDVIWGAGMGYAIGRWVVRNRSTRFRNTDQGAQRVSILPIPASGVYGLQISGAW